MNPKTNFNYQPNADPSANRTQAQRAVVGLGADNQFEDYDQTAGGAAGILLSFTVAGQDHTDPNFTIAYTVPGVLATDEFQFIVGVDTGSVDTVEPDVNGVVTDDDEVTITDAGGSNWTPNFDFIIVVRRP